MLRRTEFLNGNIVELAITHRKDALRIVGAPDSPELRARMTRMFQLNVDTAEFVALTRNSPPHEWVEREGFGRLLCGSTLWEDAVKIIATTNTMWSQTVRMVELLVQKCGRSGAFPEPSDVARFTVDELQRDCRLGYRAKSIHALATFDLTRVSLSGHSTEEQFKSYRSLPGIGPYGAAHLLAMDGRHDFIAVDTEFRRFVREHYHRGSKRVSDATMLRRYAKWGKWKYLAYWAELWGEGK
ncbi:MAG TPA: endonuclease III domain-containing protein [Thermoanaerobaculia bacterium]|nr:endonuclease III domain-containing protein [Thermoanaerobaculia bacterium]